jgi:HJR/Mrr/RecB family endonuclease
VLGPKDSWISNRTFYEKSHATLAIEVFQSGGNERHFLNLIQRHSKQPPATFEIQRHAGTICSTYRILGPKNTWISKRTFYDKWDAKVAIEVFQSRGSERSYLSLVRRFSKQKPATALIAVKKWLHKQAAKKSIAKRAAEKNAPAIESVRAEISSRPNVAELRFELALLLLSGVRGFEAITRRGAKLWKRIQAVRQGLGTISIRQEALKQLNLAFAFGVADPLTSAKTRFLVIKLTLAATDLQSVAQKQSKRRQTRARDEAEKRLLPLRALADDLILDTARHLRRDPHDIEAISIQKAAYEFLTDQKGLGKAEQALRQAKSVQAAGLRTKNSKRGNLDTHGIRRKRNGLELEATAKKVLEKLGMEARTTQVTGDGGIDVEAYDTRPFFAGKYIVQCKDWEQPVGEPVIRELYGVTMAAGANKGILISSGSFTRQAEEFAKGKPLELIDGETLRALLGSLEKKSVR